ncbi:transporter [Streptomyces sp. NPDC059398]|uniref:transporter n=1 Tax=Streptomyces sp. NPDC059398 TaxID=3346820 RepID=UPI0036843029
MRGTLWLAWRQQRTQLAVGAALLVACAVWVVFRHSDAVSFIDARHLTLCKGWNGDCSADAAQLVLENTGPLRVLGAAGAVLPVLIGLFWGAPLIGRELESGTFRLALTQGISPVRWFASRFAFAAVCTVLVSAALAGLFAWWWAPVSNALDGLYWSDSLVFDATGPAAVAAALFGLAAGTAAGLVLRRMVPAMGVALVVIGGVRVVLNTFRFHTGLVTPVTRSSPGMTPKALIGSARSAGDWGYITPSGGHEPIGNCELSGAELKRCMAAHSYTGRYYKVYPSSDFWTFQWIETAALLVLAAACVALTVSLLRRRRL